MVEGTLIRLGMLTPSSNTILEPVTAELIAGLSGVSVHFSRFKVTEIALDQAALGQFDLAPILAAADLLSHAKVDVVAWNGTSASWLGLERDRALVAAIESATGIKAATCVLGYFEQFARMGVRRLGLVSPYTSDVQAQIADVYAANGIDVIAEQHAGLRDNFSFATLDEAMIEAMIRSVARSGPDAIAILCTNMRAAALAARLELELGIPILDSVAVTLAAALDRVGSDAPRPTGYGRVFLKA